MQVTPTCLALSSFTLHRLKDPEKSYPLRWPESKEELLLQSKNIQLMSLLSNNQCCNTLATSFSLISLLAFCYLLPCMKYWNTRNQCSQQAVTSAFQTNFSLITAVNCYNKIFCNKNKAIKTKLLSSSSQCPSVHQVLASRFASADSMWWLPVWASRVTHQTRSALKHFHTAASILHMKLTYCSSETRNLGNALCQVWPTSLLWLSARDTWAGADGMAKRSLGTGTIQEREHEGSLGFPGSSWWQYPWLSGMVGHNWKASTDSFFLLLYLEVFISKTWLAPHTGLVLGLSEDENAQQ